MKNLLKLMGIALIGLTVISFRHPISEIHARREAYEVSYDGQHKQPRWVYQCLTEETLQGIASRNTCLFLEDSLIPKIIQSTRKDYSGSGFDRGHLCPAADAYISDAAMQETFLLSNISPQLPQFNRGYWSKLERHVRELTKIHKVLHVYTGPLYLPQVESDGKKYVKYEVIGESEVAVPTHFFKAIFIENPKCKLIGAFILPNEKIPSDEPLDKFMTTIEKIEKVSGVVFHR